MVGALLPSFVALGLEAVNQPQASLGLILAAVAAVGLSGIAKPTGFLIGSGFALWFAISLNRSVTFSTLTRRAVGGAAVLALVMSPTAGRYVLAHGWMQTELAKFSSNGGFGIEQTLDNVIRDTMLNFNTGIPKIDEFSNLAVETITSRLRLNIYRYDTSEAGNAVSKPPIGAYIFHEDFGPNMLHSILVIFALVSIALRWRASDAV